ncbi:hypothetical protein Syun_028867 [Stephania yunnanensis]|uniref:R13L1/DRL21-like LRR repeat region domain-containing protein n=1 Tax=Stephania yunnanensis TaxID=152371 RepID=A0AAP0HFJ4_9MAGN
MLQLFVMGRSDEQVLRILKPPSNIELLSISLYSGRRFPEWMEMRDPHSSSSFPRLETIKLNWMWKLEEWVLNWRHKKECLPALQHLDIQYCYGLKGLPQLELMTSLKELTISECPKLKFVFHGLRHLTSLQYLRIGECPKVVIPKEELDALVALRGPFLEYIDAELIHEDSTTTT